MQTILGANGTIASVLVQELPKYTDRIRLVSRNPKRVNPTDELFPADLSDATQVVKAIEGSAIVYLLVGFNYDIKTWRATWIPLMKAVISACQMHGAKLVFFDNVYMYSRSSVIHMTEDLPYKPETKKGKVRAEIAQMILDAVAAGTLTALIARAADFYGPKNERSILCETVYKNLKHGKAANWLGRSDKKHTFTYTPDAARATALLGNTPDAYNQTWHLPTDRNGKTGKEFVHLFANALHQKPKLWTIPTWLIGILGLFMAFMGELHEMMYQYDQDYCFDSSKFENRFGIKPTTYEDGIREIVASE